MLRQVSVKQLTERIGIDTLRFLLIANSRLSIYERQGLHSMHYTERCIEVRPLTVRQIGIGLIPA